MDLYEASTDETGNDLRSFYPSKRKRDDELTMLLPSRREDGKEEEDVKDGNQEFLNPGSDDRKSNTIVASTSATLEVGDDTDHGNNKDEIVNDSNAALRLPPSLDLNANEGIVNNNN
ncbi:hypothetical protein BC937DRAFT_91650, partial [Endogone sp. FLAS-F59071]